MPASCIYLLNKLATHALPDQVKGMRKGHASLWIAAAWCAATASHVFAEPVHRTIIIEAMQFSPRVLEAHAGDTVEWINKDAFPHNAVASAHGFNSTEIAPGESWILEARQRGTFDYVCTLHPGMKAVLIVK